AHSRTTSCCLKRSPITFLRAARRSASSLSRESRRKLAPQGRGESDRERRCDSEGLAAARAEHRTTAAGGPGRRRASRPARLPDSPGPPDRNPRQAAVRAVSHDLGNLLRRRALVAIASWALFENFEHGPGWPGFWKAITWSAGVELSLNPRHPALVSAGP